MRVQVLDPGPESSRPDHLPQSAVPEASTGVAEPQHACPSELVPSPGPEVAVERPAGLRAVGDAARLPALALDDLGEPVRDVQVGQGQTDALRCPYAGLQQEPDD